MTSLPEHLNAQAIEAYRRREGNAAERQTTAAHLAVCEDCLNQVLNADHSLAFNSLNEAFLPSVGEVPFHLSPAEMKSYLTGAAAKADRVICESHIDICERCSQDLRSLSALHKPGEAQAKLPSKRRFDWLRPAWGSFTPARVAAVAALFALLLLALVLWRRQAARDEFSRVGPTGTPVALASPVPSNDATAKPATEPNPANQSAVVLMDNGKEVRLDQQGELSGLEGLDEASQKIVKSALAGESLAKPKVLDDLTSPRIKLLGEPPGKTAFAVISPLRRVIMEERPTLRWRALSGATSYVVAVFDEKFDRVAQSPPLSQTNWTPAAPLQRGRSYSWEVTASKERKEITAPAAPSPRAQFRILEPEKLNALTKLQNSRPVSRLALGLAYARFGLAGEAESEFRQLVKDNPDSAVAKKLLRTVQVWQKSR